jgi:CBS domain-containing protein
MQILEKLVTRHLHRLYVVDEMTRPVGIVTLTDILRKVMQQSR